jgi:alkanesulfonate monooxygenase SsuD/methylene tetrahydromethanopterin reductase-like flavin-dependent oxidoreductase (luciferase family)
MRYPHPLQVSVVCGQRAPWPELVARVREAEELGFHGFNVVDHFYGVHDVMDPTHEAWTALAGLAMASERIRLGVMVCGNTYRNPAFLLKQAITVDHISNGRVDFGVGAGWLEREHEAYGFAFASPREFVDRFAEALEIWDLLQQNERTNYEGHYYQLVDAPFEPKALQQPRLPVLIGASLPRMLALTARYADIWNARGTPEEAQAGNDLLDEKCHAIGRDPAGIVRSVSVGLDFFDSVAAFEAGVAACMAAGFTDFQIPWPRTPAQHAVMRQVAEDVVPTLRQGSET